VNAGAPILPDGSAFYEASHIKRRRANKDEVAERRTSLFGIISAMKPMTVRQVFYQATVRGIVEKSEAGYAKVQTDLVQMRRAGFTYRIDVHRTRTTFLPYGWLADNTRWQRKPVTYSSIRDALRRTAELYRKALWDEADCYAEIWLEKDALSGVIYPTTSQFDVPLMVARGYASLSFLHTAAEYIRSLKVPTFIFHLGDFDPSGVNAGEKIEQTLREMAPKSEIHFERLAVTPAQIAAWDLPTRPTKSSDSRAKGFGDISVELDAVEPAQLRNIVYQAIEKLLPEHKLNVLKVAEESERAAFSSIADLLDPNPENFVGDGSGEGAASFAKRLSQIEDWIRRGAPLPPSLEAPP